MGTYAHKRLPECGKGGGSRSRCAPAEGWPLWCERQIDAADVVLMICTETYHRRVKGDEEQGKGLGVVWEARIIRQLLYELGTVNNKFVPVLFSDTSPEQIPTPIRDWTRYVIDTEHGYEELYRRLTGQPRVQQPLAGDIRPLKPKSVFPDTPTDAETRISPPNVDEPLIPNLSSKMGSIHVHIDGGEDKQLAKRCARLIDPNWSRSEIAEVIQFVDGPQRNDLKHIYAERRRLADRFIRTLKEQIVFGRIYQDLEEVRTAVSTCFQR